MLNMNKYLTIIITTSPIKSNPDISMIQSVLESFKKIDFLNECEKIIICDGFTQNKKNENKYKKGLIDPIQTEKYIAFIENLQSLSILNSKIIV